jgi:hypothetical protein
MLLRDPSENKISVHIILMGALNSAKYGKSCTVQDSIPELDDMDVVQAAASSLYRSFE